MPVFSIFLRGSRAPHDQKIQSEKQAGKQKEELSAPRYHHIPTHAAVDALLGGPAGWMRDDAQRIRESNLKRTTMDAARPGTAPRPGNSTMLSPLHTAHHARGGTGSSSRFGYGSGVQSSSSNGSNISPRWSQPSGSSLSVGRHPSSQGGAATSSSPDYSSLDAEIYRARRFATDTSDASQTAGSTPAPAISPSPSLTSSSMTLSASSSPSATPNTGSALSLNSFQSLKNKDAIGVIYEEHSLSPSDSLEMRNLKSGAVATMIRELKPSSTARFTRNQPDLPSIRIQEMRQQTGPYAQPARQEDSLPLRPQTLSRPVPYNIFPVERSLVPAIIPSPSPSPTLTDNSLDQHAKESQSTTVVPAGSDENKAKEAGDTISTKTDSPAVVPVVVAE
ncbi:hypothetical protein SEPCBS57363_000403 [Sporothrix epigloea]|uniref:Uncharacterized protein n=1 Tax=Sporothrix epigloea TaxID=1892477 RepID=A0ABP0D5H2_9PEZI